MSLPPQQPGQPVDPEFGRRPDPQQQPYPPQPPYPQPSAPQPLYPQTSGPQHLVPPQPAGPPQPISVSFGGSAGIVKGVGIGCLVVVALCAVQVLLDVVKNDPSWIALAIVGVLVGLFGALCLASVRNIRGAGLAVGADGIQATLQGRTVRIGWHEIAYVGISITSSGFDGPGAPPVPSRYRGRSIIRIRLAGTTPGFTDRPDMKFLVTNDEQAPYTHKLPIAKAGALGDDRFGFIDPVARALAGFGGTRFTGVEQKRVAVGRYS
ncbi:hypothetical protein [Schumannella soli]|uniref:Uncharacterized protein n=1 Tax=Schumannella soli TaxID=2590779 RepID=A0A506YBZ3_9MICO|nr:hypothetical protein [Schumannella soli]TPW77949.1 hypothetical protein FJ657_04735 [Schumannella soli]